MPANFFSVKCMRFFVSTESEFLKIYRHLPLIAEGFQQLPKISQRLPMITEGLERFLMTSKQGVQRFSKDFQAISSIIKEFRRFLTTSRTSQKNWIFILLVFKEFHSLVSIRREKYDGLTMWDHNFRFAGVRLTHNAWELAGTDRSIKYRRHYCTRILKLRIARVPLRKFKLEYRIRGPKNRFLIFLLT